MMDLRQRVLELFEAHRQAPGTPYDESHFLDFLLAKPRKRGAVRNSFLGLRRFNAFINQLQLEFAICFSSKDRDTNFSLDRFIERVVELRSNPRSSLASLRGPLRGKVDGIALIAPLFFWIPAVASIQHSVAPALVFAGCGAALLAFFRLFYLRERRYLLLLQQRILQQRIKAPSKKEPQAIDPQDAAR
jgi:hypothetical protein